MNDLIVFIAGLAAFVLFVAAILMPLVVIMIHGDLSKCKKTLALMEDMMRNGK